VVFRLRFAALALLSAGLADWAPALNAQAACSGAGERSRLAGTTAKVAQETRSDLVMDSAFSLGHDACSADLWSFPLELPPHLMDFAKVAYHCYVEAMQAIAGALAKMVPAH
jgi:hypothetical protein